MNNWKTWCRAAGRCGCPDSSIGAAPTRGKDETHGLVAQSSVVSASRCAPHAREGATQARSSTYRAEDVWSRNPAGTHVGKSQIPFGPAHACTRRFPQPAPCYRCHHHFQLTGEPDRSTAFVPACLTGEREAEGETPSTRPEPEPDGSGVIGSSAPHGRARTPGWLAGRERPVGWSFPGARADCARAAASARWPVRLSVSTWYVGLCC